MVHKTLVLKAGGVVVGTMKFLTALAGITGRYRAAGDRVVLTVSAPDKVTDLLIDVARNVNTERAHTSLEAVKARYIRWLTEIGFESRFDELLGEDFAALQKIVSGATAPSLETKDAVLVFGEILSVKVVAAFLESQGIAAEAYDTSKGGMVTDESFGSAEPLAEARRLLRNDIEAILLRERVGVVTGFIGRTTDGRVTTLGRGGSDYTATTVAAALRADRVEIIKETPLRRTDPRIVPSTPVITALTYEEAAEGAAAGVKAIHPRAIGPVRLAKIIVWVRDINAPELPGTRIGPSVVSFITCTRKVCWVSIASESMCDVPGFLSRASQAFSKRGLDINVAATGNVRVSFTITYSKELEGAFVDAMTELRTFAKVVEREDSAVLTVVAPAIGPGLIAEINTALAEARIALRGMSMAGSVNGDAIAPQSVDFVVADNRVETAVRALHTAFFEL